MGLKFLTVTISTSYVSTPVECLHCLQGRLGLRSSRLINMYRGACLAGKRVSASNLDRWGTEQGHLLGKTTTVPCKNGVQRRNKTEIAEPGDGVIVTTGYF